MERGFAMRTCGRDAARKLANVFGNERYLRVMIRVEAR